MRDLLGWFARGLLLLAMSEAVAAQQGAIAVSLPAAQALPQPRTLQVFGQDISYYDSGQGPVVVLLHGMASQARFDWGHVIAPLSRHYRVIALDQIGFGRSAKPAIDYRVQTFVDFLGEFLRLLKVQDYTLAGESLGGWIAAAYTIQALDAGNVGAYAVPVPARLLLQAAAGNVPVAAAPAVAPPPRQVQVQGSLAEARTITVIFDPQTHVSEEFVRQAWEMKMQANDGQTQRSFWQNLDMARDSVHAQLPNITIPTLVVWGEHDRIVPIAQGQDYAARIPGARWVVIPGCGHAPSLERPQAFLDAIARFLPAY